MKFICCCGSRNNSRQETRHFQHGLIHSPAHISKHRCGIAFLKAGIQQRTIGHNTEKREHHILAVAEATIPLQVCFRE